MNRVLIYELYFLTTLFSYKTFSEGELCMESKNISHETENQNLLGASAGS